LGDFGDCPKPGPFAEAKAGHRPPVHGSFFEMWHGEFRHPRLVEVYDAQFSWSRDDDFFLAVVNETPSARVVDLGCGTGRLTLGIAAAGHSVTGVDPARASIAAARAKPGADRVTWIEGTSRWLPDRTFDVVTMTAHVARIKDDLVNLTQHYELDDGEKLISSADMRFRSEQAIREAVENAGLTIEQIYGGWNREPVGAADGELVVLARRTS
jgi:2-polyprenyl-3-methyl-5-hydroxy-6-metoxy-1,4-benzoquinol methylase